MDRLQARANMIEQQIRPWDVLDQRVLDVIGDLPREKFVAECYHGVAYSDHALPIGHSQKMLNPNMGGRLLQSLNLKNTDSVLEIGTGSGYLAACLSRLAGKVTTIEINHALSTSAAERLTQLSCANVNCKIQDAAQSWDADDRYDAIAFTGSLPSIPQFYKHKMALGGRLFAVLGNPDEPTMEATLLTRLSDGEWVEDSLFETHIPALLNFEPDCPPNTEQFVF